MRARAVRRIPSNCKGALHRRYVARVRLGRGARCISLSRCGCRCGCRRISHQTRIAALAHAPVARRTSCSPMSCCWRAPRAWRAARPSDAGCAGASWCLHCCQHASQAALWPTAATAPPSCGARLGCPRRRDVKQVRQRAAVEVHSAEAIVVPRCRVVPG